MSHKIPVNLSERDLKKLIVKNGWILERNTGGHTVYGFPGRKDKIIVGRHGKKIPPGNIRQTLEQLNGNTHVAY